MSLVFRVWVLKRKTFCISFFDETPFNNSFGIFKLLLIRHSPQTHFTKEHVHNNNNNRGFVDGVFDALKSALKDRRSRGTDETEIEKSGTFLKTHRRSFFFIRSAFNENWKSEITTTPRSLTFFSILSLGSSQEEFTAGGGGARGYCDSEEIKDAMKECEGTRVLRNFFFLDTNSR